jgi:hypothetical protein
MEDSLKYDPLRTFREGNDRADAIDKIMSIKVESNLENKIRGLLERHKNTDDDVILLQINAEIKNTRKDIEDLQKSRMQFIKKTKENV